VAVYKCAGRNRYDDNDEPYCSYEDTQRWMGRCPGCGGFYDVLKVGSDGKRERKTFADIGKETAHVPIGLPAFDTVLSGGLVEGSTIVISGPPGVGKSSLLVAVADAAANAVKRPILYASGEQNEDDLGAIAFRLGVTSKRIEPMGNASDIDDIIERARDLKPFLFIVDSLQVVTCSDVKGAEGSLSQGQAVTNIVTSFCKEHKLCAIVVCHVTKDGELAGGKVVEHLVDTVLEFDRHYEYDDEGALVEESKNLRVLRSGKNRNGAEGLEAFFEMTAEGLKPVRRSRVRLVR
jgi:DNA repair protein RadA/Sms